MTNETQPAQNWLSALKKGVLTGLINASFTIIGLGIFIYFTVISNGTRIKALEAISEIYVPRFIKTEQQVVNQDDDLKEIKSDVKDIKNYLLQSK